MKIKHSTVQFKLPLYNKPDGSKYTLDEVPYWKLYATTKDPLQQTAEWQLTSSPMTFNEVIDLLQTSDIPRQLIAWPRLSKNERTSFTYCYLPTANTFIIVDKHYNILYFEVNADDPTDVTYIAPKYKYRKKYLLSHLFWTDYSGSIRLTPKAVKAIDLKHHR